MITSAEFHLVEAGVSATLRITFDRPMNDGPSPAGGWTFGLIDGEAWEVDGAVWDDNQTVVIDLQAGGSIVGPNDTLTYSRPPGTISSADADPLLTTPAFPVTVV